MEQIDNHKYDDMIDLPHHVSTKHPQMPIQDRAAQFAPFAALTGHKEAIKETARLTDEKIELDEDRKVLLDRKLQTIYEKGCNGSDVCITYFVEDKNKEGGTYQQVTDVVKKIDEYAHAIVMRSGKRISIDDILDIHSDSISF